MEENVWINKEACLDGPKKGYPRDPLERHAVPYGNRQKVFARDQMLTWATSGTVL